MPSTVRDTCPAPSWIEPEKIVLVLTVLKSPRLSVAAAPLLVTVPAPDSEPIVSSKPPRSRNAPEETVKLLFATKAPDAPAVSVPAVTFVPPP